MVHKTKPWHYFLRHWSLLFVIITGIGLSVYTHYRAATLAITHDEAIICRMIQEHSAVDILNYIIPQDHMVNTLMMKWSCLIFPHTEYTMRLPNLIGHLLYIIFSILLLRRLRSHHLLITGFILLNFNPYLLDFFSIARGYGLSVAFMMVSLYFAVSYAATGKTVHLVAGFFSGLLAVLTVYTLLNYYFALVGLVVIMMIIWWLSGAKFPEHSLKTIAGIILLVIIVSSALLYAKLSGPLEKIQEEQFIYARTMKNFYTGTIRPIVYRSIYNSDPGLTVDLVSWAFLAVYALVPLLLAFLLGKKDYSFTGRLMFALFIISVVIFASITAQFKLFNVRFLQNRTATFIAPVMILMLIGLTDELRRFKYLKIPVITLAYFFAFLFAVNTIRHANCSRYLEWEYDADTRTMIRDLEADAEPAPGEQVRLGIYWIFEPSVNFYRDTWELDWLNEVDRDGYEKDFEYFYVFAADSVLTREFFRDKTILKTYPISGTALIRK